MNNKKSLFSFVEIIFLMLLFGFSFTYFYSENLPLSNVDNTYTIISLLDIIEKNQTFSKIIILEDFSVLNLSQNWSSLTVFLDNQISDYYLSLSNGSISKNIVNCSVIYSKQQNQILVMSDFENNFSNRVLTLGVCN